MHALPQGPLGSGGVLMWATVVSLDALGVVHGLGVFLG